MTGETAPWTLGRWSPAINAIAIVWIAIITIVFMLPPNELVLWTMLLAGGRCWRPTGRSPRVAASSVRRTVPATAAPTNRRGRRGHARGRGGGRGRVQGGLRLLRSSQIRTARAARARAVLCVSLGTAAPVPGEPRAVAWPRPSSSQMLVSTARDRPVLATGPSQGTSDEAWVSSGAACRPRVRGPAAPRSETWPGSRRVPG